MDAAEGATRALARFCAEEVCWERLPQDARERARELVLDFVGVGLRGSTEASSQPGAEMARQWGAGGQASVLGMGACASAPWAALANGTAAHAIEMDDVTTESSLHPAVAVIPAALALAEERHSPATDFLAAVVAGYEVTMRVGNALNPASAYARGFHPTGVAGAFGAAVAAGKLLGLDADGLTSALGIAGSLASGSLEYLADGAWTKRLNAGWAAHAGIVAAQLAASGFVGPKAALEGRLGALHAYSDESYPDRLLADLGTPLQVLRVSIKPYACCRYNHGLIDAMLQLRQQGLRPADVARIRLGVLSGGALLVADPIEQKRAPRNVVDAQFSAPFAAALALTKGSAVFRDYTPTAIADAEIQGLMLRTACVRDDALDAVYPRQWPAWAEVTTTGGSVLRAEVPYALGEPENPVPRDALIEKFVDLAAARLPEPVARTLAERILRLDEAPDLIGIGPGLRGQADV